MLTALLTPNSYVFLFLLTMIFTRKSLVFPSEYTAFNYSEGDKNSDLSTVPTWSDPIPPPTATPVFVFCFALVNNNTNNNGTYATRSVPLKVSSSNQYSKNPSDSTWKNCNRLNVTLGCHQPPIDTVSPTSNGLCTNNKNTNDNNDNHIMAPSLNKHPNTESYGNWTICTHFNLTLEHHLPPTDDSVSI